MKLSDSIELKTVVSGFNENLDEIESIEWIKLGKCIINPNTAAKLTIGNDGKEYLYSYEIMMKKPKGIFPKEGDEIHIVKQDGTIDKVCKVSGFVTLKTWLKLWV